MLDLREANLMMVGSSVQETLCTGHMLSESVISSPGEVLAAGRLPSRVSALSQMFSLPHSPASLEQVSPLRWR